MASKSSGAVAETELTCSLDKASATGFFETGTHRMSVLYREQDRGSKNDWSPSVFTVCSKSRMPFRLAVVKHMR